MIISKALVNRLLGLFHGAAKNGIGGQTLGSGLAIQQLAVADGLYTLREPVPPYGDHFDMENKSLMPNNTVSWQTKLETTEA
jgi:hypothetical protein